MARGVVGVLAIALSAGCARVEVHGADGVTVHRAAGILHVSVVPPAAGAARIRAAGLGVGTSPLGMAVGAWRLDMVAADTDCRLIVFAEPPPPDAARTDAAPADAAPAGAAPIDAAQAARAVQACRAPAAAGSPAPVVAPVVAAAAPPTDAPAR